MHRRCWIRERYDKVRRIGVPFFRTKYPIRVQDLTRKRGVMMNKRGKSQSQGRLPIGHNEDVEYAAELADHDDREAQARAAAADERQSDRS